MRARFKAADGWIAGYADPAAVFGMDGFCGEPNPDANPLLWVFAATPSDWDEMASLEPDDWITVVGTFAELGEGSIPESPAVIVTNGRLDS